MKATCTIEKHLGKYGVQRSGYVKEVNLVSWNLAPAKIDLRAWDAEHKNMSKGITLTIAEAKAVCEILSEYLKEVKACDH